jgi:hypothetical protein
MIPGDAENLKPLENGVYQLKKDVINNGMISIEANTVVRLIVDVRDNWIKIYGYKANEELLLADRYLIVYMFDADFQKKKYTREEFDVTFNEFLKPYTGEIPKAKTAKAGATPVKGKAPVKGKPGDNGTPPPPPRGGRK